MARGPFAPVEQAPIEDSRLVQSVIPVSAEETSAGAIGSAAQGAANLLALNKEKFQKGIEKDLRSNLNALEQGLAAVRDPVIQQQIFDAAAEGNPFFQKAKQEFIRLTDAIGQGKLPGDSAVIRARGILNSAITDIPEFEDELRKEAKEALGFSPEAAAFRSLITEPTPKTPRGAEKGMLDVAEQAAENGVSLETQIAINRQLLLNKLGTSDLNLALLKGDATSRQVIAAADNAAANATIESYAIINSMLSNGGIDNPETVALQIASVFDRVRDAAGRELPGLTDARVRGEFQQNMNNRKEEMLRMIKDGSIINIFKRKRESLENFFQLQILSDPVLGTIHTATKGQGLADYLTLLDRFPNQASWDVAKQGNPALGGLETLADLGRALADQVQAISNGTPAVTPQEKAVRAIWDGQQMRKEQEFFNEVEAFRAANEMEELIGPRASFEQYDDNKVLANVKRSPQLQQKFASLLAVNMKDNTDKLIQELGKEFTADVGLFVEDGVIHMAKEDVLKSSSSNVEESVQISDLKVQLGRVNRMLKIAKKYGDANIISDVPTPEGFLVSVNASKVATVEEEIESVLPVTIIRRYDPATGTFTEVSE